jgi:hypothetical protein
MYTVVLQGSVRRSAETGQKYMKRENRNFCRWCFGLMSLLTLICWTTPAQAITIGAGEFHSLGVRSDGTVVAWGASKDKFDKGQCDVPAGLIDVVAAAAGGLHSLALKSDGTVVAWGANGKGQCTIPVGLNLALVFRLPGPRYVSGDGDCENHGPCYRTIQSALDAAGNGELIKVEEGAYDEAPAKDSVGTASISGGWNHNFTGQPGTTTMYGPTVTGSATVKLLPNIRVAAQP